MALKQVNAAIDETVANREALIRDDGDMTEIRRFNKRIEDLYSDQAIYEQKRSLLEVEAAKVDTAAAEQARSDAIANVLQPQADVIGDLAGRLETKLGELSSLYAELVAAEKQFYAKWPAAVPHDKFYRWTLNDVRQRLRGAAGYAAANSDFTRSAMWANTFGERTTSLSVSVRKSLASYLANLKVQPLPVAKKVATEEVV